MVMDRATATEALSITIKAAPTISTTSLPNGEVSVAYSQTLTATYGTTPYTWSISSGALPAGLSLSSAGVISGTPTTAGTSNFTVQVADSVGGTATKDLSITIEVVKASTTTTVMSSENPSIYGDSVTFAATVSAVSPGTGAPTGTVQFKSDGVNLGSPVTLSGGSATSIWVSALSVGSHAITAVYSGDANFATSTSSALTQNVYLVTCHLRYSMVDIVTGSLIMEHT